MKKRSITRLLLNWSLLCFSLYWGYSHVSFVHAKPLSQNTVWAEPINLSHSGSTSVPQLIIDSAGRFHALWVDKFAGYVTAYSFSGNNWGKPTPINFPFGKDSLPVLLSDLDDHIHAFWIDRSNTLLYSRVAADKFNDGNSWEETKKLAESALDFSVLVDSRGTLHLVYFRILSTTETPSGIYYQKSSDDGTSWDNPQAIYESEYFRSLKLEESNVNLSTTKDGSIYVVWDNRPLKLIFFTKSINSGNTWIEPQVLKSPQLDYGNNIPFGININSNGNNILIVWQLGQPNGSCEQYSQWSTDKGSSWNAPSLINRSQYGCSPESKLFVYQDLILLMTKMEDQSSLLAWNGSQWSNAQNIVSSFIDPETGDSVAYQALQTIIVGNSQLYVIGYDSGGLGDTWLTWRSLESIPDWFPKPSDWSEPDVVYTTPSDISSIKMLADEKNQFHIFWIQVNQDNNKVTYSIEYSKGDGSLWSQPVAIISSQQGEIAQLDVGLYLDHLLVVWSEGYKNQILFSLADADTALNPTEWTTPILLSTAQFTGMSPRLLVDYYSGNIYVVYAKPINEDRGIYFVKSTDEGKNWSKPIQVFKAESAEWDIVDLPNLATDQNGSIHIVWARRSFPEDSQILALYTTQSGDQGTTWTTPKIVAENNITWSQITGNHRNSLHRFWQAVDISTRLVNWHQYSNDGGATWSPPTSITDPEDYNRFPILTTDTAGRLYLFQPLQASTNMTSITYRLWDSDRWIVGDSIIIGDRSSIIPDYLAAAISPSGKLILVYKGIGIDKTNGSNHYILSYVSQQIEIPSATQATRIPNTTEATQISVTNDNVSVDQTPTVEQATTQSVINNTIPTSTGSPWMGLIVGGGFTVFIVTVIIAYRLMIARLK